MTVKDFFTALLSWSIIFPTGAICLYPMKNALKYPVSRTVFYITLFLVPVLILCTFIDAHFHLSSFAMTPIILLLAFLIYYSCLKVHISKALAIFVLTCAFMSFFANYACGFDAIIHPNSDLAHFSLEAGIFQTVISSLAALLLFRPVTQFGSRIIDRFDMVYGWCITIPVSCLFLGFNLFIAPRKYETLYVNKVFMAFLVSLTLMFILQIMVCVVFYFIVTGMVELSETRERNHLLEMQESQYIRQARYIEQTQKARHDFKHTIHTIDNLAASGDLEAVRSYIADSINALPKNDITNYCKNLAVNALLNYYTQVTDANSTRMTLDIDLPDRLSVSDVDLCSIIGNILENATLACQEIPEEDRFIELSVSVDHDTVLYIVATNSFNGKVIVNNGRYLSTRSGGSGIGLTSITSTVSLYGGYAGFSHKDNLFMTDIMIPLRKD